MVGWYNKTSILLTCLLLLVVGLAWSGVRLAGWLYVNEVPHKAEVAVCLNSSDARVDKVVELYRRGYVDRILVTYPSTRTKVIQAGVPAEDVKTLNGGFTGTFDEAWHVVELLRQEQVRSAIIVSDPFHMYRARWSYDLVNVDTNINLTAVATGPPPGGAWWETAGGRFLVLSEVPKIVYYWLGHGLLGMTTDPPWVVDLEKWYVGLLKEKLGVTAGA